MSSIMRLFSFITGNLQDRLKSGSDSRCVHYPWAIAPTINTRKLVATAIATFVSTDKFIIFPSIMAATLPTTPVFEFFPFLIASNSSAQMDAKAGRNKTESEKFKKKD